MARSGALRDALVLLAVFALLLGGLFAYTGTWPPAVIVESSSMMHADSEVSYGRLRTIDPGDLVLVKDVDSVEDVQTLVEGGKVRYGASGDVVIYYPANDRQATPIIHRAVAYVEVQGAGNGASYRVRWDPDAPCEGGASKQDDWCVYGKDGVYIPSIPVQGSGSTPRNPVPYKPPRSGFITKGDNPVTNTNTDQATGLSRDENGLSSPVPLAWVEGKGRGELPWLGLIKLSLAGRPNELSPPPSYVKIGSAYAPKDLWVMLGVSLFVLVGVPLIYDGYKAIQHRRAQTVAPSTPSGLFARPSFGGGVSLSWSPSPGGAHNYRIYRDGARIGSTRETTWTDATAEPGVSHTYSVTASSEAGAESAHSENVTTAGTTPAPPQQGGTT